MKGLRAFKRPTRFYLICVPLPLFDIVGEFYSAKTTAKSLATLRDPRTCEPPENPREHAKPPNLLRFPLVSHPVSLRSFPMARPPLT